MGTAEVASVCSTLDASAAALRLHLLPHERIGDVLASMDEAKAGLLLTQLPGEAAAGGLLAMPEDTARLLLSVIPEEFLLPILATDKFLQLLPFLQPELAAQFIESNEPSVIAQVLLTLPQEDGLTVWVAMHERARQAALADKTGIAQTGIPKVRDVLREMPEDWLAGVISTAPPSDAAKLCHLLDEPQAASVIFRMNPSHAGELFSHYWDLLSPEYVPYAVERLTADQVSGMVRLMPKLQCQRFVTRAYGTPGDYWTEKGRADLLGEALAESSDELVQYFLAEIPAKGSKSIMSVRSQVLEAWRYAALPTPEMVAAVGALPKERMLRVFRYLHPQHTAAVLMSMPSRRAKRLLKRTHNEENVKYFLPEELRS
jgi:Mg/Co/Ni transporter MgtE